MVQTYLILLRVDSLIGTKHKSKELSLLLTKGRRNNKRAQKICIRKIFDLSTYQSLDRLCRAFSGFHRVVPVTLGYLSQIRQQIHISS